MKWREELSIDSESAKDIGCGVMVWFGLLLGLLAIVALLTYLSQSLLF